MCLCVSVCVGVFLYMCLSMCGCISLFVVCIGMSVKVFPTELS